MVSRKKNNRAKRSVIPVFLVGTLASGLMVGSPAHAIDYPTWEEVLAARSSETTTQTLLATIRGQLQNLTATTDQATATAKIRGREFESADDAFQNAAFEADRLRTKAAAAEKTAALSRAAVAQMVAYQARASGSDLTAVLLARDQDASDLLARLEFAAKLSENNEQIFTKANRDGNLARSGAEQAKRVTAETARLKTIAANSLQEAQAASDAADAALAAQIQVGTDLEAQLAVLASKRSTAEADYTAGVTARAAAQAAAEAARAAANAASRPGPAGTVSAGGWANPTVGNLVSGFGFRIHPISQTYRLHSGIDIAGGCNAPIYATGAGRVVFSGDNGGYGNYILIQHDSGEQSAYAHIVDGGRLVQQGQTVQAGQMIARTGSTGASTGCHLHLEIRTNGAAIDPVTFLQRRGVTVG